MALIKKITTVASGTMVSRLLGFIREVLMAAFLGTGPVADAFNAAFRFPNSFRRLFAEGAFNSAFVPLFAKKIEQEGMEGARRFGEEVFGVLFSLLLALTILMELSMPLLVAYIIAPGFSDDAAKSAMTARLATIMFPYLACMSLAAMMGGMLNALHRYFAAAIAPVFLNIILIGLLFYGWINEWDVWQMGVGLSWGVMVAGLVQLAIVFVAARRAGMKIGLRRPRLNANVRRLLALALPAALTGGITQINLLINTNIASGAAGAISTLAYADRLYQLPLGVIGIAVATVLLPELARALRSSAPVEAHNLQNRAVEFTLFLTLPAAAIFIIMPEPIVRLIYQRGQFDSESTHLVASCLALYGLGLPAFVLIKALIPGFFAREDTKTPMIFAAISVVVNITLAIILFAHFSVRGIVIAEISAGWVNAGLLFFTLLKRGHWQADAAAWRRLPRLITASVMMGAALYISTHILWADLLGTASTSLTQLTVLALTGLIAGLFYLFLVLALGAMKLSEIRAALKKR